MHTTSTANETLEFLGNNYHTLCEQVDPDWMESDTRDVHIKQNSLVRPFRIKSWLTRLGYFITAWTLWEYHARSLCKNLPKKVKKEDHESTVEWVGRSLKANTIDFTDQEWFVSANSFRNLIVHSGARADGSRAETLLERSRTAFPNIETWPDGYVDLQHCDVSELYLKIRDFICGTASQDGNVGTRPCSSS